VFCKSFTATIATLRTPTNTTSSGVCAIVKGVYVIQLRSGDFSYNGKDVTIWTAVETATAIIAASIPVLRVFFKDKVKSYGQSNGRSRSGEKPVPLSNLNRSHTATIQSLGKSKDGGWTTLEPIEDGAGDSSSERGILRDTGGLLSDEEQAIGKDGKGFDGIMQTNTFSVTVDEDRRSQNKGSPWLGAPS
jgi:hypothetical protein